MPEDMDKKIEEMLELSRENNKLLKKVRRVQKRAQLTRMIYWLFIIAITAGSYFYIQPYIEKTMALYNGTTSSITDLKNNLPDAHALDSFLNQINGKK